MPTKPASRPSTPPSSPSASHHSAEDSLFSRAILAPVLFLSFIFSLLIIDRKTASTILRSPRGSPLSSPDGKRRTDKGEEEYYHSHQRKLARREMDEAFAIRRKVMVGMGVFGFLGLVAVVWVGLKIWEWVNG